MCQITSSLVATILESTNEIYSLMENSTGQQWSRKSNLISLSPSLPLFDPPSPHLKWDHTWDHLYKVQHLAQSGFAMFSPFYSSSSMCYLEEGIAFHHLYPQCFPSTIDNSEEVLNIIIYVCGSLDGRRVWGEWIHVHVWLSLSAIHLKLSQHCSSAIPRQWRGRWEGGQDGGTRVHPWLIHVDVRQKPLQYCKVISLQLKYVN